MSKAAENVAPAAGRICARLLVEARDSHGRRVALRKSSNIVVRSGAELLASLLTGASAAPINGFAVGLGRRALSAPYELTELTVIDESGEPLAGPTAAPFGPDAFKVETLADEHRVRITVRGVLPAAAALAADGGRVEIGEAALGVLDDAGLKLARIYNHVVFDPIPKEKEHELVLYWEISFPYGVA